MINVLLFCSKIACHNISYCEVGVWCFISGQMVSTQALQPKIFQFPLKAQKSPRHHILILEKVNYLGLISNTGIILILIKMIALTPALFLASINLLESYDNRVWEFITSSLINDINPGINKDQIFGVLQEAALDSRLSGKSTMEVLHNHKPEILGRLVSAELSDNSLASDSIDQGP